MKSKYKSKYKVVRTYQDGLLISQFIEELELMLNDGWNIVYSSVVPGKRSNEHTYLYGYTEYILVKDEFETLEEPGYEKEN